jgi:hypothetical protein
MRRPDGRPERVRHGDETSQGTGGQERGFNCRYRTRDHIGRQAIVVSRRNQCRRHAEPSGLGQPPV